MWNHHYHHHDRLLGGIEIIQLIYTTPVTDGYCRRVHTSLCLNNNSLVRFTSAAQVTHEMTEILIVETCISLAIVFPTLATISTFSLSLGY